MPKLILSWMPSTWVLAKLCSALFPSTLLGTLPVGLLLWSNGALTPAQFCLCVMLSMSMVGSLARLEVSMNEIKQMGFVISNTQSFLDMPEQSEINTVRFYRGREFFGKIMFLPFN